MFIDEGGFGAQFILVPIMLLSVGLCEPIQLITDT